MRVENEHTLQGRIENKEREKNSKERSTLEGREGSSPITRTITGQGK